MQPRAAGRAARTASSVDRHVMNPSSMNERHYPGQGASIGRLLALVIWFEHMSHASKFFSNTSIHVKIQLVV